MYVIFDSNIWISELGLNSTLGAAVRFFVKKKGITVVLPEVIRLETENKLKADLTKHVADLQKNHRELLSVFGQLRELVLPEVAAIDEKIATVFSSLELELLEIPFSLESARSSFMKTIHKLPPSRDKDQQFKDGVIWADTLRLLQSDDVCLVTQDKSFYKDRNPKCGLADNLKYEMKDCDFSFKIFEELAAFLQEIRTDVAVDQEQLVTQFWDKYRANIEGMLARHNFAATEPPTVSVELFVTENTNKLYCGFEIYFDCEDLLATGRVGSLRFKGDGTYLVEEKLFSELRSHGEELIFSSEDGEQRCQNGYIHCDGIFMGHKTVEHSVKYKLTD